MLIDFFAAVLCRVCMESVKKHAVVCEECSLIAHSKCKGNAPPTCGLRAQLLQYANYSSQPDSPNALDILQQFTPSSSPAFDTSGGDQDSTPHPSDILQDVRRFPSFPIVAPHRCDAAVSRDFPGFPDELS